MRASRLAYAAALALAVTWLAARLERPVARAQGPVRAMGLVISDMTLLGALALLAAPAGGRLEMLLGHSWDRCPLNVPALAAALWALRGLAPTRPRRAGMAAGLLAGALGAMGYALSCTGPSPPSSPSGTAWGSPSPGCWVPS